MESWSFVFKRSRFCQNLQENVVSSSLWDFPNKACNAMQLMWSLINPSSNAICTVFCNNVHNVMLAIGDPKGRNSASNRSFLVNKVTTAPERSFWGEGYTWERAGRSKGVSLSSFFFFSSFFSFWSFFFFSSFSLFSSFFSFPPSSFFLLLLLPLFHKSMDYTVLKLV